MRGLRVAAVQLGLYRGRPDKTVAEAERLVRQASRRGGRLICLPEHWLLSRVLKEDDGVMRRFSALARELDAFINMGANFEQRGVETYMTSTTLSPEGHVLSRQDKIHLYRREKQRALPGSRFDIMTIDGFKVAVLVCHDVVFPETAREVTLGGAELLLVPSLISAKGIEPWLIYLRARALENRIPIVAPNIFAPPRIPGRSCVVDLKYDREEHVMELVERTLRGRQTSIVVELDLLSKRDLREERLHELRRSFPWAPTGIRAPESK
ncbi:MAG: carbon-nitrogen hydrolase family protein [Thaumarchaeota archaeon]|nr:carbon-nitrogen hydrolase family protein [Nitrososphaerota archaeon]